MEKGKLYAIIIRSSFNEEGLTFPTSEEAFIQVGIHVHKTGFKVNAHKHKIISELVNINLEEIFYIKSGKVKIKVFNSEDKQIKEVIVSKGDLIILYGGHSVDFLEDSEMIEIKQGPYRGKEQDKVFINDTSL